MKLITLLLCLASLQVTAGSRIVIIPEDPSSETYNESIPLRIEIDINEAIKAGQAQHTQCTETFSVSDCDYHNPYFIIGSNGEWTLEVKLDISLISKLGKPIYEDNTEYNGDKTRLNKETISLIKEMNLDANLEIETGSYSDALTLLEDLTKNNSNLNLFVFPKIDDEDSGVMIGLNRFITS